MIPTIDNRPAFALQVVGALVADHFGIDGTLVPLPAEWDQNLRLTAPNGDEYVVKIANAGRDRGVLEMQDAAMARLRRLPAPWCPRVVAAKNGSNLAMIGGDEGKQYPLRILTFIPGTPLSEVGDPGEAGLSSIGAALGELDSCLAQFTHPSMTREFEWDLAGAEWISSRTQCISDASRRRIVERMLLQFRARVRPILSRLPASVIHNDANDENILMSRREDGAWSIAGLLDFGDMMHAPTVCELAIASAYAVLPFDDPISVMEIVTAGYHGSRPLSGAEADALLGLTCMRLCVSVTTSAIAALEDPDNEHRQITDRAAWRMLEILEEIDWRSAADRLRRVCGLESREPTRYGRRDHSPDELLAQRRAHVGPSLSLSYDEPLEIVEGRGQFLYDSSGRAWLDCVNNVCHVGHSHPHVVTALATQAARLNTNTRYLHPLLVEYAGRLTATLPDPLNVCYFVNSGSEANELAVRLAQTHTGRRDAVVLEGGYHGNTSTLIDLSPYKCEGPGGKGLPDWVHKVVKPDPYRGPHRDRGEEGGAAYAGYVGETCERLHAQDRPPAFFLCEPLCGCGGQIIPPSGYLAAAFEHARDAGAVCIADEVQVGMGRVGTHWWAFEALGAVPDIVTIGKPIGNGHPLGAVVTTPEIAASFDNGMEFFSTFGGNPVSAAVGMAVLDVIEDEGLRERAARVGRHLRAGFSSLANDHPMIGDVRGMGMFIGVELVRDRTSLEPATDETSRMVEMAKKDGVLLSAEGPFCNVLKIKPPLQFEETDADLILGSVNRALDQLSGRSSSVKR